MFEKNNYLMNGYGWLYLIKNGDLYKIGITRNFENRMKRLKPDKVVARLYSSVFKELERELHKRYKNVRIPQTEYFRLEKMHIREIKQRFRMFYYPMSLNINVFLNSISLLLLFFFLMLLFNSFINSDIENVVLNSLKYMDKLSISFGFLSLLMKSNRYFSLLNELRYRSSRFCIFALCSLFFRFASNVFMFK